MTPRQIEAYVFFKEQLKTRERLRFISDSRLAEADGNDIREVFDKWERDL